MNPEPCRCECGYRCGGPGRCQDPECFVKDDGQHFVRDCEHSWNGKPESGELSGGAGFWTSACSRCGESAMAHDARTGP